MAYTPKRFYIGQPGTSATTLATVPSGKTWIVKQICLANTTSSNATVTIYLVPSGGSAGATNTIVPAIVVSGNSLITIDLAQVMSAGDFIAGLQGTANAVTVTISGVEVG